MYEALVSSPSIVKKNEKWGRRSGRSEGKGPLSTSPFTNEEIRRQKSSLAGMLNTSWRHEAANPALSVSQNLSMAMLP